MQKPPISLENLTQGEKDLVSSFAYKKLQRSLIIYIPIMVIFGFSVWYLNEHYMWLGIEDYNTRGGLNLALVLLSVLSARLLVSAFMDYKKATGAWQKKIFRGKIQEVEKNFVMIVNQKVKIPAEQLAQIKKDDEVEIAISPSGGIFIYMNKIDA